MIKFNIATKLLKQFLPPLLTFKNTLDKIASFCNNFFMKFFPLCLSYAKFEYSNYKMVEKDNSVIFSIDIKNTSKTPAKEALVAFSSLPNSNIYRPLKELKGFNKILIEPNECKTLEIEVNKDDFLSYKLADYRMAREKGNYYFYIAKNADEILKEFDLFIDGEFFDKIESSIKEEKSILKMGFRYRYILFMQTSVFEEIAKEKNETIDIAFAEQWQSGCLRWMVEKYFWNIPHIDIHNKIIKELNKGKEKPLGINYISDILKITNGNTQLFI